MAYLSIEAIDFLRELELNNDRTWFEANKKRYEQWVKKPMEAFAEVMIERMKEIDPHISILPKDAIFRIYRDVRFSKDKSPYKTNIGMGISGGNRMMHTGKGLYWHLDPRCMGVATGFYMLEPSQIAAIRNHIAGHPKEFEKQLADKGFQKYFGTINGEKNKVLPAELRDAAAKQPYIFNKQFYYWKEYEAEEALRDDLPDFIMEHIRSAQPMSNFLGQALQ